MNQQKFKDFEKSLETPYYYYPSFQHICKGVSSILFLSNLLRWNGKQKDPEGWIYKTQKEIEKETGLTRREQETARKNLKKLGFIEEKYKGLPRKLYFKINIEAINEAMEKYIRSQKENNADNKTKFSNDKETSNYTNKKYSTTKDLSIMAENDIIECRKETLLNEQNSQTVKAKNDIQECPKNTGKSEQNEHANYIYYINNNINNKTNITTSNTYRDNKTHKNNNLLRKNNKVSNSVCKNLPKEKIDKIKNLMKGYKLQNLETFVFAYATTDDKLENLTTLLESRYFANMVINKPAFIKSAIRYNYDFSYLKDEEKAKGNNTATYQKSAKKPVDIFLTRDPNEYDGLEEIFKNAVRKNGVDEANYETAFEHFSKLQEEHKTQETIKADTSRDSNTSIDNDIDELIKQLDIEFELDFKNRHGHSPVFQAVSTLAI
ncbi:hypothetical protein ACAG39_02080 [Caldicellulosiruptoraceae bacterium PP1]